MRFSTRLAKIIFITTAIILLGISTLLYLQINDLSDANEMVNHTNEVNLVLEQVLSSAKDIESAQRGYLLTGDSLFVQPYLKAFEDTRQTISGLKNLTKDNNEQEDNVEKLETFVDKKFSSFGKAINDYQAAGSDRMRKQILLNEKALLDSVRMQTIKMKSLEARLMGKRKTAQNKHALFTPVVIVLLIFVSLGVLSLAYYRITLDLKRSENYLAQLQKLNAELLEKNRQLQISNEELDSFNYISSHDLQEPVRKIRTFISMIREADYEVLSERSKHNFQRMQASAIRIQELLHDLLTYSQINKPNQEFTDVDLNKVIERTKEKFEVLIEKTKARIQYHQLPTVKGIPYQLDQLFEHLISNSLKYKKDHTAAEIRIQSNLVSKDILKEEQDLTSDTYHKITFSDNGIGFDPVYKDKIFELFAQLHAPQDNSGTGIGLTICKRVVQNHKGLIKVRSKVDDGTVFDVYLPA